VSPTRTVSVFCLWLRNSPPKNVFFLIFFSETQKKKTVVIGDESGVVTCLEFAKSELTVRFKTPSFSKEITRIELTGPNYLIRDRICVAGGSFVRCFSTKGKEFFKFDTNSTEPIRGLGVEETFLWTAGVLKL